MSDLLERLKSALADRYVVESEIGRGGMATVFLAEDLKHHRQVAIKVLHPELAAAVGTDRFLREIETVAGLQHPHVLPLHDSGEADGLPYYVMPFVEGESLRERLGRENQLGVDESVRIAVEVADGLDYAHEQRVIHRDIKPGNILLSRGHAMIADFGVARAVGEAGADSVSAPGLAVGTPAYMSPEQGTGTNTLDGRSDIYSLGCVLYEMLAGHPPFMGSNRQEILARHLMDPVPSLKAARSSIPDAVDRTVRQALAKTHIDRFATASEFAIALRMPVRGKAPSQSRSIVVLPFNSLSIDPENEYFSDGLTDEIITDLSKVQALHVISRYSAMQLKGTSRDTRTIGRELNVRYVLGGSVRKAGNSLRVTAELIDTTNDARLWAEKYSGELEDVFDIQEKLSRTIVDELRVRLSPEEDRQIGERPIENIQAHECYLRARQEMYRFTEESFDRALELLQDGLRITGENTLLYALMGTIYVEYVNSIIRPGERYLQEAEECARKLFGLEPESSDGHFLRGAISHKRGDIQEAVRHLKLALAVDPNNADALFWLSYAYRSSGKEFAARPLLQRLVSVDPLSPSSFWGVGWVEFLDGHFEEAITAFRRMYEWDPESANNRWAYAFTLAVGQHYEEAFSILDLLIRDAPDRFFGRHGLFFKLALQGNKTEARRAATAELAAKARWDEQVSWMMAACYAMIDDPERALDWLENAVRLGFINYPFLSERDPFLRGLHDDPRFRDLLDEVKRRWEQFEV